jgi:tetrahydromethanopterin S-methyltransferase subunit D
MDSLNPLLRVHFGVATMSFVDSIIQGLLTGFGSAIGSYLALKYVVDHPEKIKKWKDQFTERIKDAIKIGGEQFK